MGEGRSRAPSPGGEIPTTNNGFLIHSIELCVKTLVRKGKAFHWPRPSRCDRCGGLRLWGHGYVPAFFDGIETLVYLKRYRCPDCRAVYRMKPVGYWPRFWVPMARIKQCLFHRLRTGRWPPGGSPPRQRHWLRGLRRQVKAHLGQQWISRLQEGFEELCRRGICAVSRSV